MQENADKFLASLQPLDLFWFVTASKSNHPPQFMFIPVLRAAHSKFFVSSHLLKTGA